MREIRMALLERTSTSRVADDLSRAAVTEKATDAGDPG